MPLPTGNLTARFDASHTGKIWENWQAGSPYHNTTPSDGSYVGAWENEEAADMQFRTVVDGTDRRPIYRQSVPILKEACLDFDPTSAGANGSDYFQLETHAGGTLIPISSLITNSAFTIHLSFVVESAFLNSGNAWENHGILGDFPSQFWGLLYRNNGGQLILQGYNWDGNADVAERNISVNTAHTAMFRHEGGNIYLSVNGGAEASAASGNTSNVAGVLRIGGNGNFRVGEIAFYNSAQSGSDLADAIDYFYQKWVVGSTAVQQPRVMVVN